MTSQTDGWNCYHQLLALTLTLTPILTQTFCDSGPSRRLKVPWLRRSSTTFLLRPLAVAQHRFITNEICFKYFQKKNLFFPVVRGPSQAPQLLLLLGPRHGSDGGPLRWRIATLAPSFRFRNLYRSPISARSATTASQTPQCEGKGLAAGKKKLYH